MRGMALFFGAMSLLQFSFGNDGSGLIFAITSHGWLAADLITTAIRKGAN